MNQFNNINAKIGKYRWTICALVFFATTVNYLDRQVVSLLKPILETEFNWSEIDYSNVVIAFQIAYAIGFAGSGWIIDKIGTKLGYALSLTFWSLASISHAFAKTTFGFRVARAALGLSEGGNWPAAIKTVAEWFPKKERALPQKPHDLRNLENVIMLPHIGSSTKEACDKMALQCLQNIIYAETGNYMKMDLINREFSIRN